MAAAPPDIGLGGRCSYNRRVTRSKEDHPMADDQLSGGENVIVVSFADDSKAYDALTALEGLDSQGQLEVIDVAVVTRAEDGRVQVKDDVADDVPVGTAGGGV